MSRKTTTKNPKFYCLWQFTRINGEVVKEVCSFGTKKEMNDLMTKKVIIDACNNATNKYYKIFSNR